jgi:plastocyanin
MLYTLIAAASATKHVVTVKGISYNPAELTIAAGDTVFWDFGGSLHSVTQSETANCRAKSGGFNSKNIDTNFEQTFTQPGEYFYYCAVGFHCNTGMKGKVTVKPALKRRR